MVSLGVNIDHVATIRQARKTYEPDPVEAAFIAEKNGADAITTHLREDRRHIQDRDLYILKETVTTRLNLEMAMADEIIEIALKVKPDQVTLVPEKREEVTTEGGLDVAGMFERTCEVVKRFNEAEIEVSLFIDPELEQIEASHKSGASIIELHTGTYANWYSDEKSRECELEKLIIASHTAGRHCLKVNAGHGLTYHNVAEIAAIKEMHELNIGHSIISRAVMVGLPRAVREMREAIRIGETF